MGKPVVASNIAGYASILTDGVEGILVPPKDDGKLARALISLMSDETLRQEMGASGLRKAAEYDWRKVAHKVQDYYVEVLKNKPTHRETFSLRKMILEKLSSTFAERRSLNGKTNRSS